MLTILLKRWTAFFNNIKIKQKLFLSYFLVTLIPITLLGYFTYNSSVNYHKNQSIDMLIQLQHNTIADVVSQYNRHRFLIETIYNNNKMWEFISGSFIDDYEEYLLLNNFVEPVLQSLLNSTGKGICISLIRYGETKSEIIPGNFEGIQGAFEDGYNMIADGRSFYQVLNAQRLADQSWFMNLNGSVEDFEWHQLGRDHEYHNISIVREVVDYLGGSNDKAGMIRLTISLNDILGEEKMDNTTESSFSLVFDKDDRLLSHEQEKIAFYQTNQETITQYLEGSDSKSPIIMDQWIFLMDEITVNDWKMVSVFPISRLTEVRNYIRNLIIIYFFLSIIFMLVVTFLLSDYFSLRITRIALQIERITRGNFETNQGKASTDEIGLLASGINTMTIRINKLINENYEANIGKKDAQLAALQAQINPHFLYNSMSAIDRMADIGEINGIKNMVDALVRFYRMTLNKGREIITIGDEIQQVKAYVDVISIRKSEYFNILYDIDPSVLQYYTIKVILQPFVENIFEHALYFRENPINIRICARREDDSVVFKIIDDGIGFHKKRLGTPGMITSGSMPSSGYGIKNVEERIRMYYGSACSVEIFSLRGAGTTIRIQIPIMKYPKILI